MMGDLDLRDWVGKREEASDRLYPTPARALALTLDQQDLRADEGDDLPELWHWLYFLPLVATSGLGIDGHPQRGGFLPPIPLERRMWAGGRLTFHRDLHIGEPVRKTSEILTVAPKQGKAGPMVFVTVRHAIEGPQGVAVEEEQDIVYLTMPKADAAPVAPPPPDPLPPDLGWTESRPVDPVLLFRFSALTFNSHRIHHDLRYATEVERYPGLVVHGPLQAVLLMESARRHHPGAKAATYTFRAGRPIFDFEPATVAGRSSPDGGVDMFTANSAGDIAMRAHVTWR